MANRTKTSSSKTLATTARTVKITALNQGDGALEDETVLLQGKKKAARRSKKKVANTDGRQDAHAHIQVNGSLPVDRHIVV